MSVFHNMEPYHHEYYINSPSTLSSPSSVYSMNADGNNLLYGSTMSSMSSPMSGNMSPLSPISSSDSSSAYNFQHLQISSNANEYLTNSTNARMDEPFLEITEQPIDKFRFRYKSEMHGTHGMLTGQYSKKTFPSVRLRNFNGEALIRCSLYQIMKLGQEVPFPHSHSLVVRCGNEDKKDPHEVMVSPMHGYKATFQGMVIIHTARRFIEDELFEKLLAKAEFESGGALTKEQHDILRSKAKTHSTDMNLNQVSLCFEAYERRNGQWTRLCEPIFSTAINNLKSALTGELKISRMSTYVGSAAGNDDLFMFVEKVGKKNIKVRFYELDRDEQVIWEDWGKFTEADVHHQYAIALKTPPYRKTNIEEGVKVLIQLYRPGDEAISEPVEFRYKPSCNMNINRKRPRVSSFYDSDVPATVTENAYHNQPDSYVPQSDNMNDDTDILQMFPELFNTNELAQSELALNPEDVSSLLRTLGENNEYDKLAKDSVTSDDEASQSITREQNWIQQFLEKIDPLLKINVVSERFRVCRRFIEYIFRKANFNGDTMIHIGVKSDDLKFMDRLCDILNRFQLNELLNLRNFNKENGVHLACALNKPKILQELIKYGADLNAIDIDGNTALHLAIQENNDKCTTILLSTHFTYTGNEIHIDLSILNDKGYTPLHIASMKNHLTVIKMLDSYANQTKKPIYDDVEGKHGNNALHIAIESEAREVAEFLIQNKCINPTKTNKSGHTALYLARVAKANDLVNFMQRYTLVDEEQRSMEDDDDASSKDSFESQDTNKTNTSTASFRSAVTVNKVDRKNCEKKFDDCCYVELSDIFNKNAKWKSIANILGYQDYVDRWQQYRNPTKVLLVFTESLKVPKERLISIFEELGEKRAAECIHEWKKRV